VAAGTKITQMARKSLVAAFYIYPPRGCSSALELARSEFFNKAWIPLERVIALVVQPGVEFGDHIVYPYDRPKASALSSQIMSFQ